MFSKCQSLNRFNEAYLLILFLDFTLSVLLFTCASVVVKPEFPVSYI